MTKVPATETTGIAALSLSYMTVIAAQLGLLPDYSLTPWPEVGTRSPFIKS